MSASCATDVSAVDTESKNDVLEAQPITKTIEVTPKAQENEHEVQPSKEHRFWDVVTRTTQKGFNVLAVHARGPIIKEDWFHKSMHRG